MLLQITNFVKVICNSCQFLIRKGIRTVETFVFRIISAITLKLSDISWDWIIS